MKRTVRKPRKRKATPTLWLPAGVGLPDPATLEALSQAPEAEPDIRSTSLRHQVLRHDLAGAIGLQDERVVRPWSS